MSDISVKLPDGSSLTVPSGTAIADIAQRIGPRLAKAALAARVDGALVDLGAGLDHDAELALLTFADPAGRDVLRHSTSHVMAQAVRDLFPGAKLAIGPPIDDGFYYDFEVDRPFEEGDLERIEQRMKEIVKLDAPFAREELPLGEARIRFEEAGDAYKVEILDDLQSAEADEEAAAEAEAGADTVTLYHHDTFTDLCRGPHVPSTGKIDAFKLLSSSGAYWRGDERRPMLQRIYGTVFPSKKELKEHLAKLEEAKKRDHRLLGRELDLFSFHQEAGAGLVYYHPKGAMLRRTIEDYLVTEHIRRGYELVMTPHLVKADIWETSGHAQQNYPMYYTEIDRQRYGIKPMNCPGHVLIYKRHTRSYRDLPIRYFELGTVYRHERAGVLHGLLRVRGFTQDDAHIFCRPDQLEEELIGVLEFAKAMLQVFGFSSYDIYLSTRPEKSLGSDELWERATSALRSALEHHGEEYSVDPGEGVFYGPKIDVKLRDALDREWQGPTIQCDFNLPERFDLAYVGEDGKEHQPAMVHRVVLAGIERFLGALIENCAGAFDTWLAPVQAVVLPIAERHTEYGQQVLHRLFARGLRAEIDARGETLGYRIRQHQGQKVPYMLVVGDKEQEAGTVAVRSRGKGDEGAAPVEEFIERLAAEAQPPVTA